MAPVVSIALGRRGGWGEDERREQRESGRGEKRLGQGKLIS